MSSILPGYNYDIFISYRQKDNKYDGWVTEFVGNLMRELVYESGHLVPLHEFYRETLKWFDKYFGPVK